MTTDFRLPLTVFTYNPDDEANLTTNGIIKIFDDESFTVEDNTLIVNKNGTMIIIGYLYSSGGTYHFDKVINEERMQMTQQYNHYYDFTEVSKGDKIYFIYKNTEAYWFGGNISIILYS